MSESEEKMGSRHFEASQDTPSSMSDEHNTTIYHENGALTVNMQNAEGDTGGRVAVKRAKDGFVSHLFDPPISKAVLLTEACYV